MKKNASSQKNNLDNLRHSCAHLLAAAVLKLWPQAKPAIGPAIEHGFYYDFDFGNVKVSDEDLPKIEEEMRKILPRWKNFKRIEVSSNKAIEQFGHNEYKQELIKELSDQKQQLTLYQSDNFVDLCRGGHVDNPSRELKHFTLLSIAGAYWRGDEKNKMLTRIYGTAFPSKKELDQYLTQQEEAKKRDHKKLGRELDLFVFSETVGKGLPLLTPKGSIIRRELERFIMDEEIKRGYSHVYSPDIANLALYKKSGHYPYYKDSMYAPLTIDDDQFMLRPMTCPHHFELYLSKKRSYRELPIRLAELANLYRYEQSGELSGLQRVRTFTLADAHIICTKQQAEQEIHNVLDLIEYSAKVFGLQPGKNYHYRLSLGDRDNSEKYFKDDASWDQAENLLRDALTKRKAHFVEAEDEAAFYGPKIDVQMVNVNGKEDTAFTVQYDFVMSKRFNLTFVNKEGKEEQAVVIHRSSIGAIERVMAFLIEHYGGKFPLWLSPVQIALIPIAERHNEKAREYEKELREAGIRVELDDRAESMQAKIRDQQLQKVPFMGIIGDREVQGNTVSLRTRESKAHSSQTLASLIASLKQQIDQKT